MKLELNHVLPYASYGLKGCYPDDTIIWTLNLRIHEIQYDTYELPLFHFIDKGNCKPIVRPLSDLTKAVDFKFLNLDSVIPLEYISTSNNDQRDNEHYLKKGRYEKLSYWKIERLLELHFDLFGLIDKGLAFNINTLKT